MANNWQSVDSSFPTFQEGESPYAQIQKLTDYMMSLTQVLKYSLSNLSTDNWNSSGLKDFSASLTGDIEKDLQTVKQEVLRLHSTVSGISSSVSEQRRQIGALSERVESLASAFETQAQTHAQAVAGYKQNLAAFEQRLREMQSVLSTLCEWFLPDGECLRIGYEGATVQLQGDVYINGVKEE